MRASSPRYDSAVFNEREASSERFDAVVGSSPVGWVLQVWLAAVLFGVRPTLGLPFCLCTGLNVPDWTCVPRTNCS